MKNDAKKCEKCDKKLRTNHVCPNDNNKSKDVVTDFPCKICGAYLSNEVSLGYHLWKHTKDPKYIVAPSVATKSVNEKSEEKTTTAPPEKEKVPPEAHALNSVSQLHTGQPLCLQTSGFVDVEKEVKPLNMQVVCNAAAAQ